MIGSAYPSKKYLPKDDAAGSFSEVKNHLKGDIVFGNLEGVFLDEGESQKCEDKEPQSCYVFRMPERYGKIIKEAGFNLMSTANNHAGDFGLAGRKTTAKVLDDAGIYHAGTKEYPVVIFEKDNIKYGFCAFAPNKNMLSLLDVKKAKEIVRELKSQTDITIVSFHPPHLLRKRQCSPLSDKDVECVMEGDIDNDIYRNNPCHKKLIEEGKVDDDKYN